MAYSLCMMLLGAILCRVLPLLANLLPKKMKKNTTGMPPPLPRRNGPGRKNKLPECIYISPGGECYHTAPECQGLRSARDVAERRVCKYCAARHRG